MKTRKNEKSIFQLRKEELEKARAEELYREGFSTRKVSALMKAGGMNRSHTWVAHVVKERIPELSTVKSE